MIAIVRRNLSCLIANHNPPFSHVSLSYSLSTSSETTRRIISDTLLKKYDFPPELASRIASKLTDLEHPQKADSVLSFFKESGFSNTQLAKILKYKPRFLVANVEDTLKPKFKLFEDLGFSSASICSLFASNPTIMHLRVNSNIIPSLSVVKELLGPSSHRVAGVIMKSPRLLSVNLETSVLPNVEFLKNWGVPMDRIRISFANYPNPFLLKPEVTMKSAEKVRELGIDVASNSFIYAISAISSMRGESWKVRMQDFRDMGFSDSEFLAMFKKSPRMVLGSKEKKQKIIDLLVSTGKFDIPSIVQHPLALSFSVEQRYKPRLRILEILDSQGVIKEWPDLTRLCKLSDDEFFKKIIRPCLDEDDKFSRGKLEKLGKLVKVKDVVKALDKFGKY